MINYETRQKIVAQALQEIEFARNYKQKKTGNWRINEDLYYSKKVKSADSRANVDLGQMASFVHTILSKIDSPLIFKFTKRKNSQTKRIKLINRLREIDAGRDDWDLKDIVGKKQAIIYGRAIYSYSADSKKEYTPHLENVDVYDFLVDPSAGGIDLESASYLGRYGVVKTKTDLKAGVKDKKYLKTETNILIDGNGNATEQNQEVQNASNRTLATNVSNANKQITTTDKYVFWEWYTTFEGERYYLLLNEKGATAIRVEKLTDLFESNLYPFWTWAAFPDLSEFWTPSFCDYVREIFMAQAVSINQMLDNAEQINKPMRVVNVSAIENLAELKYRREGIVKVKGDFDVNRAYQAIQTPSINTPINVFNILENIQEKASGVNATAKGVSDVEKATVYQGNQANTADRFGYLNKSYSFGYKRFAKLWLAGVKEHLVKRIAIDILGIDGIEIQEVSRRDLFRKSDMFNISVEASNAELELTEGDKRTKLMFLSSQAQNPTQNPRKAYEISASISGFSDEEIRELMDTAEFSESGILVEAERDIEDLLDGKEVLPNQNANNAYKQRFVDYLQDNMEHMNQEQFFLLSNYVSLLEPIIYRNMTRKANEILMKQKIDNAMLAQPPVANGKVVQGAAEKIINQSQQSSSSMSQ